MLLGELHMCVTRPASGVERLWPLQEAMLALCGAGLISEHAISYM